MRIDQRKIAAFLKSLTVAELRYTEHCMGISDSIRTLIKKHNLTKQAVCDKFKLKPRKYNDFIKGAYNYDMREMATLNAWFMELEMESLKKKVPVRVIGEKNP